MFCPRCGKEIKNNQKFCINCGYDLSKDIEELNNDFYKKSYYKKDKKYNNLKFDKIANIVFRSILLIIIFCVVILGFKFLNNYFSAGTIGPDRAKYQSYIDDPTSIPELTQPETLNDLVNNVKNVQNFLILYLKYSPDTQEEKIKVFNNYRKQILKIETFSNENLLKEDIKNSIPSNRQEFNKCAKYYNKILSPIGFKIISDTTYGKYHLKEDYKFTYKKFGTFVPNSMKSYLYLRAKHNGDVLENGGYLAVSPKEMNNRISDYEKFLNDNQNSDYINEVKDTLYYYSFAYIFANDRQEMKAIRHKKFKKWDKQYTHKYKTSKFIPIFNKMISSANGISENQFNNMYPYEYDKNLSSIRPANTELEDIFSSYRATLMKDIKNVNYKFIYSQNDGIWSEYSENSKISKDSLILAESSNGFDVYNNKFKKQNQFLSIDENTQVLIKRGQLLTYNPQRLQINCIEYSYGNFSTKILSSKAIRQFFPDVLISNLDNIGSSPVQVVKTTEKQSYMLISHVGSNFDSYILNSDVAVQNGELSNIFTILSSATVNLEWIPTSGDGKQYYITFVTNLSDQIDNSANNNNDVSQQ